MRHFALLSRLAARRRPRRALIALTAVLAALLPFAVTGAAPAAAVASGGATAYSWVTSNNDFAVDWYGNWVGDPVCGGTPAACVYGVWNGWNDHPGRIRFLPKYPFGPMWAGDGKRSGDGEWPRTLNVYDPETGGTVSNKYFLGARCDYYGLTYGYGPGDAAFNTGAQSYYDDGIWAKNPWWYVGSSAGYAWTPEANLWMWASPYWTWYTDAYHNGNLWHGSGAGLGWYYQCRRDVTQRLLSSDSAPAGAFDSLSAPGAGAVRVTGWAADRDRFAKTSITVTVDGATKLSAATNVYRPDVVNYLNSIWDASARRFTDSYGYDYTIGGLPSGKHTVCVSALNVRPTDTQTSNGVAPNSSLGCASIVVDQPPVAVNDTAFAYKAQPVVIDVLANDSDPDPGDTLTVQSATDGAFGTTAVSGNKVVYTPNGTVDNAWDTFSYTIADSAGATATASVQVWVDPHLGQNFGPGGGPIGQAAPDNVAVYMGATTPIRVLANDTVPAGMVGPSTVTFGGWASSPRWGNVSVDAAGVVSYTPTTHFTGTDSFTYWSCLTNVNYLPETQCNKGTVNVTVANRAPTAEDFTVSATPGQTIQLPFAAHVADADGDAIGITIVTRPGVGTLTWDAAAGGYTYTAPLTVTPGGKTTLTYTASDAFGGISAPHTVTISLPYIVRPS